MNIYTYEHYIYIHFEIPYSVFHSCGDILHINQSSSSVPTSVHPYRQLWFFWGLSTLTKNHSHGSEWYRIEALVCISLVSRDIQPFPCLLAPEHLLGRSTCPYVCPYVSLPLLPFLAELCVLLYPDGTHNCLPSHFFSNQSLTSGDAKLITHRAWDSSRHFKSWGGRCLNLGLG